MPGLFERWLLLPCALLTASVAQAMASIDARDTNSTTIAAPLSINPDQNWDGIDGTWSTFTLRVGTPSQYVRTLLSFNAYQTWVVLPAGCSGASSPSTCASSRGGTFDQTASSTWDDIGIYDLWILRGLDYTGNAIYGYDTVGLGGQGEGGPTLKNTTVGGLAVEDFYLGVFGVNPKPTNFTSFNDPSPSYMTLLKEQKYIPSVSFGYTAGAPYRFTGVLASLSLGGYDASRFIENDVEFTFAADNDRDIVVAIQGISTPSQDSTSISATSLLPDPIYAYIDSTVAAIWLPLAACQAFEVEFGLVFDNATGMYLVNDTLHQELLDRNPNITFTLAQGLTGGSTVVIDLPYAAFDLTAQPPFAQPPYQALSNTSHYFPIQRASNDSQYTIGRAFLQEAYITIDYERERFNVSQVAWTQNVDKQLVPIMPYTGASIDGDSGGSSSDSEGSSSSGLSTGAIAGIAVAAAAIGIVAALLLFFYIRRKKKTANSREKIDSASEGGGDVRGRHPTVFPKAELEGSFPGQHHDKRLLSSRGSRGGSVEPDTPHSMNPPSSAYSQGRSPVTPFGEGTYSSTRSAWPFSPLSESSEADSRERQIYEMPGDLPAMGEADGRQLSEKEAVDRRNMVYNGVDSATNSSSAVDEGVREPRRVNPEDVRRASSMAVPARANTMTPSRAPGLHRAFSFEMAESDRELYE